MSDNTQLMDILKKAMNCDEIIIESKDVEGNTEGGSGEYELNGNEEYEIIEEYDIIEEIQEVVEEDKQEKQSNKDSSKAEDQNDNHSIHVVEDNVIEEITKNPRRKNVNNEKNIVKQIVQYNVSEDWEDEELENVERSDSNTSIQVVYTANNHEETPIRRYGHTKGNKRVLSELDTYSQSSQDTNTVMETNSKKQRLIMEYEDNHDISNDDSQNEIVREDNDLVYTILEPKKQNHSNSAVEHQHKVEHLEEDSIPVDGTIYYDGENDNTMYVSQSGEDTEQYQYSDVGANEQEWENSQQSIEQQQYEDGEQGQIFLHEDEDGQLYFKDENGTLQPVYLTEDGNYAIAGSSSGDEQDSQEGHAEVSEMNKSNENDNYIIPDLDVKTASSKQQMVVPTVQEMDNEDSTVTISLIISEDENGQKRTQVIIPTTENLKCDICHKTFKTSFQLLKHNRLKHAREEDITTRNFPCDLCPKRFPDQNSLARHRKTHTGDRPFQCLECQKTFPTATTLRRHLTLHNPQSRPLPCIYCGRRFLEKASLAKHEQSHLAGEMKNHTCDICHKSFTQASDLAFHKKNHDPDRKFDCEVCGREFNRLNNLQRHMMVHQQQGENEEILSCEVCGITYKFMSSLTRHMVTTHMNPEKMRQQAEEQRRKRESNYRRYLENRKMYETQNPSGGYTKRVYHKSMRLADDNEDEV